MNMKRRNLLLGSSGMAAALAVNQLASAGPASAQAPNPPAKWQQDADVVVIGSGATGLPAAIVAREAGASVILVEAEKDIGGHAITSGGNVPLGGGTSAQKKYGIDDSPDLLVPRPDRLVGGRAERLSRLSLQRSRNHPRFRRQQRRDLRMAGRARRRLCRQGARRVRRHFGRQFGAARNALRGDGLADGADRQAGRSDDSEDAVVGQRPDAAAAKRRQKRPACRFCSSTR